MNAAELRTKLPEFVNKAATRLRENGYEAYLVGGSVRDIMLGRRPQDYDIATNAYPDQIEAIFEKSIPTGAKFGTMIVLIEDEEGETRDIEITTYRSEADYFGGRWPTKVEFTKTIQEDLSRRDFTINAIALRLDNEEVTAEDIVDPFDGLADLEAKVIRAVGNPVERFSEDGLRSVRACRLAANLEFSIEEQTLKAISQTLQVTQMVSAERIREELMKLLLKSPQPSIGLKLLKDTGLLEIIIPELLESIDVTQPQFHTDDVFTHTLKAVDLAEDSVKLAALFHDIGKPRTKTEDERGVHFYGHDIEGAEMTKEIMKRLKFSNDEIKHTANLVRYHMFYYPAADWRKSVKGENNSYLSDEELEKARTEHENGTLAGGWTDAAIRRFIRAVGGEDAIDDLMKLRIADATANPKNPFNPEELRVLADRIAIVRQKDMALKVTDLAITGQDLMTELNLQPGPQLGQILNHLLEEVTEEPLNNSREKLLEIARNMPR